jgi:hypothetical protein
MNTSLLELLVDDTTALDMKDVQELVGHKLNLLGDNDFDFEANLKFTVNVTKEYGNYTVKNVINKALVATKQQAINTAKTLRESNRIKDLSIEI